MAGNDPSGDPGGHPGGDRGWGRGIGYGLEVAVGMGLGTAAGVWWDKHHASDPWGVLIGLFVGGAAGMYLLIKDVIRMNKE